MSTIEELLDTNTHRMVSGDAVLDAPSIVESLWGSGHESLWPKGEPFLMCGPDGVGKTTIAQQLALALAGIGEPTFLGLPVALAEKRVLYIAADRPVQAFRSMHRMVTKDDREALKDHLVIWRGPLPFDIAEQPDGLWRMARRAGAENIIVDSLKDVAADLANPVVGAGVNSAFQATVSADIDICVLYHQRKAQAGGGKPRHISDVFGSRWITAGCGSIVMLWGDAGDAIVELTHLKQPDETIGPLKVLHNHLLGKSTIEEQLTVRSVMMVASDGQTAAQVAMMVYGNTDRNTVEKTRRKLETLVGGEITRGESSPGVPVQYFGPAHVAQHLVPSPVHELFANAA